MLFSFMLVNSTKVLLFVVNCFWQLYFKDLLKVINLLVSLRAKSINQSSKQQEQLSVIPQVDIGEARV